MTKHVKQTAKVKRTRKSAKPTSKGVKKVEYAGNENYPLMGGGRIVVIDGDKPEPFKVSEWVEGTTKEDQNRTTWFLHNSKRTQLIKTYEVKGWILSLTIPKKLCGSDSVYYLEAAVLGKPDKKNPSGLLIRGYCPPVIKTSKWSTRLGGDNIKNGTPVSYGQDVFLHLETEGINNASLIVEIYNKQLGEDKQIGVYTGVQVEEGEVNLQIKNTFSWMGKVTRLQKSESFYIKVKNGDTYILDEKKQAPHAVYLVFDNNIVSKKDEPASNNSPVKTGEVKVAKNEFDHCKYTSIVIRENKREVPVFEEGAEGNGVIPVFEVVAGNNEKGLKKISITLEGADVTRCKAKPKHDANTMFTFDEDIKKWVPTATTNVLSMNLGYDYSWMHRIAGATMIIFLWPKREGAVQKHLIKANTCRYSYVIPIHVYPDIEWELNFNYNAANPLYYGDSWQKMTQHRVGDAFSKTQAASVEGYDGKFVSQFSLVLAGKFNAGLIKVELGYQYEATIRSFLNVFMKAKRIADAVSHKDLSDSVILSGLLKNPFTLEIEYPKISIGIGWKLEANAATKEKVVLMAEGKIGFYPLLAGTGKLDLIALAGKLPVVGQVINLLEWTAKILSAKPVFELAAVGEINTGIELKKNFDKAGTDFEIAVSGKFGLRIEISIKASGKVDAVIFSANYSYEGSGVAESYFLPKVSGGTDNLGAYLNASMDFSGVTIILVIKGTFGKSSRAKEVKIDLIDKKENILKGQYYFIKNDK
ncbi:hypothetical protein H7F33_02720 [Pedobacter sp. PAMC26386]|nr:hypothetical protein H7F33_02720 [Pedobacter sp. PAMC26386]